MPTCHRVLSVPSCLPAFATAAARKRREAGAIAPPKVRSASAVTNRRVRLPHSSTSSTTHANPDVALSVGSHAVGAVALPDVVEMGTPHYTAPMDKLDALLDRLETRQRDLVMEAAQYDTMPADSTLRRIAELENAISAGEAVADEEWCRRRQG